MFTNLPDYFNVFANKPDYCMSKLLLRNSAVILGGKEIIEKNRGPDNCALSS